MEHYRPIARKFVGDFVQIKECSKINHQLIFGRHLLYVNKRRRSIRIKWKRCSLAYQPYKSPHKWILRKRQSMQKLNSREDAVDHPRQSTFIHLISVGHWSIHPSIHPHLSTPLIAHYFKSICYTIPAVFIGTNLWQLSAITILEFRSPTKQSHHIQMSPHITNANYSQFTDHVQSEPSSTIECGSYVRYIRSYLLQDNSLS